MTRRRRSAFCASASFALDACVSTPSSSAALSGAVSTSPDALTVMPRVVVPCSLRASSGRPTPASAAAARSMQRVRFVDCRWELGKPELGRQLYLAGHVPGASFLDVEQDLSAPPVE